VKQPKGKSKRTPAKRPPKRTRPVYMVYEGWMRVPTPPPFGFSVST